MGKQIELDRLFHALADPSRRLMVERLGRGPLSVSALAEPLAMSLPSVAKHLTVLEGAGLVRSSKTGRTRMCELAPERLDDVDEWVARQRVFWSSRLDALEAHLETAP